MHPRLTELAGLFFRLGATAFGGPAAHIAMMREEVVRRRAWMSDADFLDLLGATNLIPGPNSTEMAIHIGHRRAGLAGLVVAGAAFILPAAAITLVLAWLYVHQGARPEVGWLLYGVKPVVIAIVGQAIVGLAPAAARTAQLGAVGAAVATAVALGANEIVALLVTGVATVALAAVERDRAQRRDAGGGTPLRSLLLAPATLGAAGAAAGAAVTPVSSAGLFWVFAKIGSVLFGSGYVLLAFLEGELVEHLGWMSRAQLIDAIAIGQLTPGPVFTTATFVGYLLGGNAGALAATCGIFLPAFVFVAASAPLVPWLRKSWAASAFLDGVNVASLALMVVVAVQILGAAIIDSTTAALLLASAVLLVRYRVNTTWLILGGALAGWLAHRLG